MKKHILPLLVIFILSFWSWKSLLGTGYFPMHDDTQVTRVIEMGRALREGQFPVRIVGGLGYGYGYPLYNFYGPLPYYFGGFLYSLGVDAVSSTKLMFGIGIILAAVFMYIALRDIIGPIGSVIGSLFYLYAPYHAVQVYVRGSVGEYWAYAFFPIFLYGLLKVISTSHKNDILIGGLGLFAIITSHTILGYLTVIFLLLYWIMVLFLGLFGKIHKSTALNISLIIILGMFLSAFFWLPAISEMGFTNVAGQISTSANYKDHFVCLTQLWNSPWGYGGSAPGCLDGFSFKLGKIAVLGGILSLILWIIKKPKEISIKSLYLSSSVILFISIFMMLPVSLFIWEIIPRMAYVQYPWRFLAFSAFGLSALFGINFIYFKNSFVKFILASILIALMLYTNIKLFTPQFSYFKNPTDFENDLDIKYRVSKISDEYLPQDFIKPTSPDEIATNIIGPVNKASVQINFLHADSDRITINSDITQDIKINRIYFPGWHYFINGKEVSYHLVKSLPYLTIKPGENIIEMQFTDTPVRKVANCLSLLTVIYLIYIYGKKTIT